MGVNYCSIIQGEHMPKEVHSVMNVDTGFVWIIGRRSPGKDARPGDWHIQGVSTNELIAVEMCADETYFIGPLPLNTSLPHETVQWVGLYFPLGTHNKI